MSDHEIPDDGRFPHVVPGARWTEDELEGFLQDLLEENEMPMFEDADVLGHTFRIASVDHGETEKVTRTVKNDDIFTRELSFKKRLLAKAITHIDGKPVEASEHLVRFMDKCPPAVVNALYDVLLRVRSAQETRIAAVAAAVGKSQASHSTESAGD